MDSLDDNEIESIWGRVKKDLPVSRIQGKNQDEVLQSIRDIMSDSGRAFDSRGSMDRLVKHGFASEKGFGSSRTFKDLSITQWIQISIDSGKIVTPLKLASIKKKNGKISIKTKKRIRVYSKKNLKFSFSDSQSGGKRYYVYNTRTKKRVTWGFV